MSTVDRTDVEQLAEGLLEQVSDAKTGLPGAVFRLISQLTPLINVDLLINNVQGQTLLTWRDDEFYGPGWHVPGGIIRFKETIAQRIGAVAHLELGCQVSFTPEPLSMREVMAPQRDVRGHFISLLYACTLLGSPAPKLKFSSRMPKNGQWQWHDRCPDNLIAVHEMYRPKIGQNLASDKLSSPDI